MHCMQRAAQEAIESDKLIVNPKPEKIDASSIDLHLDKITDAYDNPTHVDVIRRLPYAKSTETVDKNGTEKDGS